MNELMSSELISGLATCSHCPREGLDRQHLGTDLHELPDAILGSPRLISLEFEATAANNISFKM